MSKPPQLQVNGGVFTLTWPDMQLGARLDRLREDSSFNVTAEVLLKTSVPGLAPHLHQARLNLTSTTARNNLARTLTGRVPETDWYAIVEQMAVKVLERFRAGEPAIPLSELPTSERSKYRLEPLLLDMLPNLIFGEGGTGKSILALYFAMLIAEGYTENSLGPETGKVLYLDYEASGEEQKHRSNLLYKGYFDLQRKPTDIFYRFCHQRLAAEIEELQRLVSEHEIGFIIVDSAGPACGGEPEEAGVAIAYFNALRSLRITSLTLAHQPKNAEHKTPFGSVYWWNLPRAVFELKARPEEEDSGILELGLFHRKSNAGSLSKPLGFRLLFQEDSLSVQHLDIEKAPAFQDSLTMVTKVKLALQRGGLTVKEIIQEAQLKAKDDNYIREVFRRNPKLFQRLSDEKEPLWGLKAREEL